MSLEKLDQEIFEQIREEETSAIIGGGDSGGKTISAIVITSPCNCIDAMDVD